MLKKIIFCTWIPKSKSKSKKKKKNESSPLSTLEKLHETLEMLEKKETFLQQKVAAEVQKAKDLVSLKNKKAAIQCMKKKRLYESQIEQLGNFQLRVHDQVILLEGAKATTDTVEALRSGASALKFIQNKLDINEIDKTYEEMTEYSENMKQIQDALSSSIGVSDVDEDELEAELEDLEDLDRANKLEEIKEHPENPQSITSTGQSNEQQQLQRVSSQAKKDVQQLTTLQAEMAL